MGVLHIELHTQVSLEAQLAETCSRFQTMFLEYFQACAECFFPSMEKRHCTWFLRCRDGFMADWRCFSSLGKSSVLHGNCCTALRFEKYIKPDWVFWLLLELIFLVPKPKRPSPPLSFFSSSLDFAPISHKSRSETFREGKFCSQVLCCFLFLNCACPSEPLTPITG